MKKQLQKLKKNLIYLTFIFVIFSAFSVSADSQSASPKNSKIVDKTIATISDGVRTELITYSDLLWQLALNPNVPINPPSSDNLNRALQILIRIRIIALEAERLPSAAPTQKEIDAEIKRILAQFPSTAEFRKRLNLVGFDSVKDENFQALMKRRVAIENYIKFRFRSFVVITPDEELNYYRNEFTDNFRRQYPNLLLPKFEKVQKRINEILTEQRVQTEIEKFIDNAESRAETVILNEV